MLDLLLHHIEKQRSAVTFKRNLSKRPHWLQTLPLCCLTLMLTNSIAKMMGESLHT